MTRYISGLLICAGLGGLAGTAMAAPRDRDRDRAGWCSANHGWNDRANFAQTREERLQSAARNVVDPGMNGSIRIHGWNNPDVLVKACIQTTAPSESEAQALAAQVKITAGAGRIEASGPENRNERSWSVSYEIWMPAKAAASLNANNGSITAEDVQGSLRFHTLNGSVKLSNVGGDVDGETTNGSVQVTVVDTGNQGSGGLHLATTNGSVNLKLPENVSANVEASTVNGSIRTDFPITVSGDIGKHLTFKLGAGGRAIEARTTNGSIHITRA